MADATKSWKLEHTADGRDIVSARCPCSESWPSRTVERFNSTGATSQNVVFVCHFCGAIGLATRCREGA